MLRGYFPSVVLMFFYLYALARVARLVEFRPGGRPVPPPRPGRRVLIGFAAL